MGRITYCQVCGEENAAENAFCENCGNAMDAEERTTELVHSTEPVQEKELTQPTEPTLEKDATQPIELEQEKEDAQQTESVTEKEPEASEGLETPEELAQTIAPVQEDELAQSTATERKDKKRGLTKNKKMIAGIVLGILLLAGTAVSIYLYLQGKADDAYHTKIAKSDRYMEEMDYEKAEDAYLAAIEIDPKKEDAYLKIADVYIEQKKYEKAEEILKKGKAETGEKSVKKKLAQVRPYGAYRDYLTETLVSEIGIADPGEDETIDSAEPGLISVVIEDFNHDNFPELLTVRCDEIDPELVATISLYSYQDGEVVLIDEKTRAYWYGTAGRHDIFLKEHGNDFLLIDSVEYLFSSGGCCELYVYQIDEDITEKCETSFDTDIGYMKYYLDGKVVAGFDTDDPSEYEEEWETVNERGVRILSEALAEYGFDADRFMGNEIFDDCYMGWLECDEKDSSERPICYIQNGVYYEDGTIDFYCEDDFFILDYTDIENMINGK